MPGPKKKLYFEFTDGEARRKAMDAINEIRKENPELFSDLNSVKVDPEPTRQYQGLELEFENNAEDRSGKILELLHEKGITLNQVDGHEELPYAA